MLMNTERRESFLGYNILLLSFASVLLITILSAQSKASQVAVSGEYIIKFKASSTTTSSQGLRAAGKQISQQQAHKISTDKGVQVLSRFKNIAIQKKFSALAMMHLQDVSALDLQELKSHPDVEYIEPNYILNLEQPSANSDDQDDQRHEENLSALAAGASPDGSDDYAQTYAPVQVTESWAIQKSPASATKTIVAVIDTGLDIRHAVFVNSNALWKNQAEENGLPGIDDDGNGFIDDKNGWNFVDNSSSMYDDSSHGTHVAGIVLGAGQDILQVPVRESKVKIMPLKFLSGAGSGSTANAVNAIYYAVNNGAHVINNSWGGPSYSRALHDAYKFAYDNEVVLVTAAGNSNLNIDTTSVYPAALDTPSNLTVGASTSSDRRANFSNYSSSLVHVFAPGTSVMSTIPGTHCSNPDNLFYYCLTSMNGTSMAAPFVAGLAALAIREAPHLSAYQIRSVIMSAIDNTSYLSGFAQTAGRVNALKAMQLAQAQSSASTWSPAYSPVYKSDFSSQAPTSPPPAEAGGCGLVKAISDFGDRGSPPQVMNKQVLFLGLLMLLPVFIAVSLRQKNQQQKPVRQFERFQVSEKVFIQAGDDVIESASQTLAIGGLSFKSEKKFEKGQKIKIKIQNVQDEIEGEIVWSSELNSFGVRFLNITEHLKQQVQSLTSGMLPT